MTVWQGTPGKWRALPNTRLGGHNIYDPHGIMIARTGTHSAGVDEPANAKAISAVPQLIEALATFARGDLDVSGSAVILGYPEAKAALEAAREALKAAAVEL